MLVMPIPPTALPHARENGPRVPGESAHFADLDCRGNHHLMNDHEAPDSTANVLEEDEEDSLRCMISGLRVPRSEGGSAGKAPATVSAHASATETSTRSSADSLH